jgi:hypothetical protein
MPSGITHVPPDAIGIDSQGQERFHVRAHSAVTLEALDGLLISPVCTENLIRVDAVMESPGH